MEIRAWEEKDISVIAEMEKRCFSDAWTEGMLYDSYRLPIYRCFLAEEGGQVCGYCIVIVLFEDAEVANIAVDAPHRGRGIAKALMEKMHTEARLAGAQQSLLEVRVSNENAIKLYERFGYERYGKRARYYADGEDALLMRKEL